MPAYARALATEIRMVGGLTGVGGEVHTVFFGGGTPSLLPLELHTQIFAALRQAFQLAPNCEITLEANPGAVSRAYLEGLRALGVNRLSFGAQSSHPHELRLLDRQHLFGDVVQAVTWARAAGFENLNLDLIYGLPHQTLGLWQATLNRALTLGPEHLSCYALSLERGTPLRAWVYRGLLPMPDPDLAADMYEWASETLEANGYVQYEISNWARAEVASWKSEVGSHQLETAAPDLRCRHNLQYWRNLPYLGFGAGAHGCAAGWRYSNVLAPAAYIERMERGEAQPYPFSPAVREKMRLSRDDEMGETMLLGLRLTAEGVREADFRARYDAGLREKYSRELGRLKALRLIEWDDTGVRLTRGGRLLGNRAFREFV